MQSLLKTLIFQCYISLLEPIPIPWEAAQEILQHKNTEAVKRTLFVGPPKRFFFVPFISAGIVKIGSLMEPLIMIWSPRICVSLRSRCKSFQLRTGKAATCLFELEGCRANRDGVTRGFFVGNPSENPAFIYWFAKVPFHCGFWKSMHI